MLKIVERTTSTDFHHVCTQDVTTTAWCRRERGTEGRSALWQTNKRFYFRGMFQTTLRGGGLCIRAKVSLLGCLFMRNEFANFEVF